MSNTSGGCGTCGGTINSNPTPKIDNKIINEAIQIDDIVVENGQPVLRPKPIIKAKIEFK